MCAYSLTLPLNATASKPYNHLTLFKKMVDAMLLIQLLNFLYVNPILKNKDVAIVDPIQSLSQLF